MFHGWFWLVKTNKYFLPLVNYSHQKVLLESKLILCHGSELRQNQAGGSCEIDDPECETCGSETFENDYF